MRDATVVTRRQKKKDSSRVRVPVNKNKQGRVPSPGGLTTSVIVACVGHCPVNHCKRRANNAVSHSSCPTMPFLLAAYYIFFLSLFLLSFFCFLHSFSFPLYPSLLSSNPPLIHHSFLSPSLSHTHTLSLSLSLFQFIDLHTPPLPQKLVTGITQTRNYKSATRAGLTENGKKKQNADKEKRQNNNPLKGMA